MRKIVGGLVVLGMALGFFAAAGMARAEGGSTTPAAAPIYRIGPTLRFTVQPINKLRLLKTGLKLTPNQKFSSNLGARAISPEMLGAMATAMGNPAAYSTGSGVVLDALHPMNPDTGSTLEVRRVQFTDSLARGLAAHDPNTTIPVQVIADRRPSSYEAQWAVARFYNMPAGMHTYLLSISTDAPTNAMELSMWLWPQGKNGMPTFESHPTGNQLNYNSATHELRVLFTVDAGNNSDRYFTFAIWYLGEQQTLNAYLHHVQLVTLD
jgi:hypothetical protein